jgi:hypothetical protein
VQTNVGACQVQVGPHIENLTGREMDQNGNLIPGEVPEDIFFGSFTIAKPSISGYVTATNGWPIRGATVRAEDGSASTTTDANGFYSLSVAPSWSGSVTPVVPGGTCSPANRTYTRLSANLPDQNFTMTGDVVPTLGIRLVSTNAQVYWPSVFGFKYQLKSSTDLLNWQNLGSALTGTGGSLTNTSPFTSSEQKSFRLLVTPN